MGEARRKKDTAQVLPSGMSGGGKVRLDNLISKYGYKPLGFVETKYGKVFLAERKDQYQGNLYAPIWRVIWGARDAVQQLDCPLRMAPKARAQAALDAANGYLMDRNDVYKEV